MRIVFLGSPREVIPLLNVLRSLPAAEHQLIAVVSQPPRPAGRKRLLMDPPVAVWAKEAGIQTFQPEKARDLEFLGALRQLRPDLMVTAAYGQILSEEFLKIPVRGTINFHPSLLPQLRGATPVQSFLLSGGTTTGITVLFTVKALDAGNIIFQKPYQVLPTHTSGTLMDELFRLGAESICEVLELLKDPNFEGLPQDEGSVSHCRKILKTDGQVRWHQSTYNLDLQFRAYQPWPGSYTFFRGRRLVVTKMRPDSTHDLGALNPGEVVLIKENECIAVGTSDGRMLLEAVKPEGGSEQSARDFWNGQRLSAGECFHEQTE